MTNAFGPKRGKSFRDNYLALFTAAALLISGSCSAQFPSTDSLHRYNNRYINNSAVQAFTNLRMNTLLHGMINWIDSARAGAGGTIGVDTLYAINDTTVRYKKNGVNYSFQIKGPYDFRRKVDSVFAFNDSILTIVINGTARDVLVRGKDVRKLSSTSLKVGSDTLTLSGSGGGNAGISLAGLRSLTAPDFTIVYYVTDRGKEGQWYYDPTDTLSADDTATIVTNGLSGAAKKVYKRIFERIIYPEWWGAKGDDTYYSGTNDGPAFNAMMRWIERQASGSYQIGFLHNRYYTATRITLPYNLQTVPNEGYPFLKIVGNGVNIRTDQAITVFYRMPASDADAGNMNNNYKISIEGIFFSGDRSTAGQVAMRIGCFQGSEFINNHFYGFDTAVVASFLTKCTFDKNYFTVNQHMDLKLQSLAGIVGTQTIPGSASNDNNITNNRFFEETGSYAAFAQYGADNTVFGHNVIEGSQPRYGILSDYLGSTVVNTFLIDDVWFEGYSNQPSVNFKIAGAGLTRINNVQRTYSDTLFDFTGTQAAAQFEFNGMTYIGNMATVPFIADATNAELSGISIKVTNSDRDFADLLYNSAKWRDAHVPANLTVEYFQGSNNGYTTSSSTNLEYRPSAHLAEGNGYFIIRGNQFFKTDNINYFGGLLGSATNARPLGGFFGTGGVYVDNSGAFKFGSAATLPDLKLIRDSISQLSITDNSGNPANIKAARGFFSARSGYTSAFSLETMGDNDFITKQQLNDAIAESGSATAFGPTLTGTGIFPDKVDADTITWIGTRYKEGLLDTRIDSIVNNWSTGSSDNWGTQVVQHDLTLIHTGVLGSLLGVDTINYVASKNLLYKAIDSLALIAGANAYSLTVGAGLSLTGDGFTTPWKVTNTGAPGTNPHNALDIRNFGAFADAVVPGSGSVVTGTDNSTAFQNMINASAPGQLCIIPDGAFRISTTIDTIRGKRLNLLILGTVYTNGADFLRFKFFTGQDPLHTVKGPGSVIGAVNITSQTKAKHDNGTGPNWAALTGTAFTIVNSNKINIEIGRVEGFGKAYEVIGGGGTTPAWLGSQENHFKFQWLNKNAVGISLRSLNGVSYTDKTKVFGGRVSGGLAIKIDGYASPAFTNSEVYNGAARSNEFHFLVEQVDSIADVNADATENTFDTNIELGDSTGVFGAFGYRMRSVSPNYVRSTHFTGTGALCTWMLSNGVGLGGDIRMPIYLNCSTKICDYATIDNSGNIVAQVPSSLSLSTRNSLPAGFKTVNASEPESAVTQTGSSYTVAAGVHTVYYNYASGTATLTMPSASGRPTDIITVFNTSTTNALTISGVANFGSLPDSMAVQIKSDGATWRAIFYGVPSSGAGGSTQWIAVTGGIYYNLKVRIGSTAAPTAKLNLAASDGTANNASLKIDAGTLLTSAENGAIEFDGDSYYVTANSIRYRLLALPETGMLTGMTIRVNAAGTGFEYVYPASSFGNYHAASNANLTVVDGDYTASITNMTADKTLTLPDPTLYPNRVLVINQKTGNGHQINLSRSIYFGGTTSPASVILNDNDFMIQSDGTRWQVIFERL